MVRNAINEDAGMLTQIAFAAKRFWNYPEEYFSQWARELTITETYISRNFVRIKELNRVPAGFYSLVEMPEEKLFGSVCMEKGLWLDHMFILPEFHNQGIGTEFFKDIDAYMKKNTIQSLKIFADPNSKGFYEKMGAWFLRNSDSSIPGRIIPVYTYGGL
jgi:maltose O-acetyltransferase